MFKNISRLHYSSDRNKDFIRFAKKHLSSPRDPHPFDYCEAWMVVTNLSGFYLFEEHVGTPIGEGVGLEGGIAISGEVRRWVLKRLSEHGTDLSDEYRVIKVVQELVRQPRYQGRVEFLDTWRFLESDGTVSGERWEPPPEPPEPEKEIDVRRIDFSPDNLPTTH